MNRAGSTRKISVSVSHADFALLQRRAESAHGGNVSAVIAEVIERARIQQGLEELVEWLGGPPEMSEAEIAEVDRELLGTVGDTPKRARKTSERMKSPRKSANAKKRRAA